MIGKIRKVTLMGRLGIACMPLIKNVPEPNNKQWVKTICPVCGRECWETPQLKWAKQDGIANEAACTECALSRKGQSDE